MAESEPPPPRRSPILPLVALGGAVAVGALGVTVLNVQRGDGGDDAPAPIVKPAEPTPSPSPGPLPGEPTHPERAPRQAMDRLLFSLAGQDLGGEQARVYEPIRAPYRVEAIIDEGHDTVSRARVDLDKDDRIDEVWVYKSNGQIRRRVSPDDDGELTEELVWSAGRWVPQ